MANAEEPRFSLTEAHVERIEREAYDRGWREGRDAMLDAFAARPVKVNIVGKLPRLPEGSVARFVAALRERSGRA